MILWENVAYLVDDARRRQAYRLLRSTIGTRPEELLDASKGQLLAVTQHGILAPQFAEKLREAARIALDEFDGDIRAVVALPLAKAKRALRRFPGVGEPGAEKILLFTRRQPFLAPESNGLRVLVRLGLIAERKSYPATYREARELAVRELGEDFDRLMAGHLLLRRHGQEICLRSAPRCGQCPLAAGCEYARGRRGG